MNTQKLNKAEFSDFLPDHITEECIKATINQCIDDYMVNFKHEYEHVKVAVDQKLAKIRQDFDMPTLRRLIDRKLNKEPFQEFKTMADERLGNLDNSFLLVGQDLDTV